MTLRDSVIVVTGASSGLGRTLSTMLVERGARVFGLARSVDKLNTLRNDLGDLFHPVGCDVRDPASVDGVFDEILREEGRLDVLINNAGLGRHGPTDELPVEDWDVQMETNARGVFLCARRAIPPMRQQNEDTGFGGHIINIASIAGLLGNPNLGSYNASKHAVRGFSDALMKEVRDDGIKVSCVYPGSFESSFAGESGSSSPNPMKAESVASTVLHLLETPANYLISEVVMRPLRPRG